MQIQSLKLLHFSQVTIIVALVGLLNFAISNIYYLVNEPSLSGDLNILDDTIYLGSSSHFMFILYSQILLAALLVVALIFVIKELIRGDKYGVNRSITLMWLGAFICYLFGLKTVINYLLNRWEFDNRDGQLGYMQAIFLKGSSIKDYVLSFEEFQAKYNCCGIYNKDDWNYAMVFNDNDPIIELDYTLGVPPPERIRRMGTCPQTSGKGCGPMMLKHVTGRLSGYTSLLILEWGFGVTLAVLIGWHLHFSSILHKRTKKIMKKAVALKKSMSDMKKAVNIVVKVKEQQQKETKPTVVNIEKEKEEPKKAPVPVLPPMFDMKVNPTTGYIDHPPLPAPISDEYF